MPGRNVFFAISLVCCICIVAGCAKESPVVEKKYTSIALSAYTVDPYRFRVSLNNEVVTDSLITPEGQVAKEVFFDNFRQRIRVYNTSDETLLIDTSYTLSIGKTNAFAIYQTQTGTTPFYLAPAPDEPIAAPGNSKLKVVCSGEELNDSVKVVVEIQTPTNPKPRDTAVLKKGDFSRYFEINASRDTRVIFYKIAGNQPLGEKIFRPNQFNADFTFYRLVYEGTSNLGFTKLY